jgi:diaminohydroxyphosphoribosylaminopyrimidine deaminase / 5-amino-6-(5-phosphoribosylamino)uracil reductase
MNNWWVLIHGSKIHIFLKYYTNKTKKKMQGYTGDEKFMRRCLDLALQGKGNVAPNPLVGCVIVHNNIIIGEGFHQAYGQAHAEVNAITSVRNPELLKESTLYVNLEPCSHFGKTPPCANLILEKNIPTVIVGTSDPNELVAGKGLKLLGDKGVKVKEGILSDECKDVNARFFSWHIRKRPYIILKWAKSADGFIDLIRSASAPIEPNWITSQQARILVHKWRTEEQAILVGTTTVLKDNPRLNVRDWKGKDPLRLVIDRKRVLGNKYHVFDNSQDTIVFTEKIFPEEENNAYFSESKTAGSFTTETVRTKFVKINFEKDAETQMLNVLYRENIQSLIIEGGAYTLKQFIDKNLWDEARIFTGPVLFNNGIRSPEITGRSGYFGMIDNSQLLVLYNDKII